jgi:DNA-binding sugar fermentation-stimulating protein
MKTMPNTTVQAGRADRASWPGAQTTRPVRHVSALPANPSTGMREQRGLLRRKPAVMTEFGFCDAE